MKKRSETCCYQHNNERGAALIIAIFAILLVTVIGFALVSTGILSQNIATNSREQTEAFYISESGLTHGTNLLLAANTTEFTAILQTGDGIANTGDELSTRPSTLTPIPATGIAFGNGSYIVKVGDDPADPDGNPNVDSNGRLVVTSIGYGKNGATVTSEAIVSITGIPAILVNGDVVFQGSTVIRGTMANFHANGTLTLLGTPCIDGFFSGSGNIINPDKAQTGAGCGSLGVTRPYQDIIPVPTWNIQSSFYNRSDYILGAIGGQRGKVYNSSGTMIANTASTGNKWIMAPGQEWTWNSGTGVWSTDSTSLPSATYYSEGNIELIADLGTSISPVTATFIAEGYIDVKRTSYIIPKLEKYGLMAGTDLQFATKVASGINSPSIFYAGHQLSISGNSDINGSIIVANLADTNSPICNCNLISLVGGAVKISANMTLTYNGGLFKNNSRLISWREVRY